MARLGCSSPYTHTQINWFLNILTTYRTNKMFCVGCGWYHPTSYCLCYLSDLHLPDLHPLSIQVTWHWLRYISLCVHVGSVSNLYSLNSGWNIVILHGNSGTCCRSQFCESIGPISTGGHTSGKGSSLDKRTVISRQIWWRLLFVYKYMWRWHCICCWWLLSDMDQQYMYRIRQYVPTVGISGTRLQYSRFKLLFTTQITNVLL